MHLTYTGECRAAAEKLLAGTSLNDHPFITKQHTMRGELREFHLSLDTDKRWSSGERVLLGVLEALQSFSRSRHFLAYDSAQLEACDERTAALARECLEEVGTL